MTYRRSADRCSAARFSRRRWRPRWGFGSITARKSAGDSSAALFGARYRLPAGLREHASKERFAVVDDVISAGSSVRAVVAELESAGATTIVVGSLLILGTKATDYFAAMNIPVVAPDRRGFQTWLPNNCPLCRSGVALENRA